MFPSSKAVKTTALQLLKGNWVTAAAAAMIPVFFVLLSLSAAGSLSTVLSNTAANVVISLLTLAVLFLVGIPIFLGTLKYYWNFAYCENADIKTVFSYFSSFNMYSRAIKTMAFVLIRAFGVSVICLLPSGIIDFIANGGMNDIMKNGIPLWFTNLWIIALFLRGIGIAVILFYSFKYYLVPFLLVINDQNTVEQIITASKMASKKSSIGFAGLIFGLLGWTLISFFVVPLVFTLPYIIMCYTVHSRFAVFFYNNTLNNSNSSLGKFVIE